MNTAIFTSDNIVRNTDGTVNEEASVEIFRNLLSKHLVTEDAMREKVASAVHSLFDTHVGAALNMTYIISQCLHKLNATPHNVRELTKAIEDYVRENADKPEVKDKETKAVIVASETPGTRMFSAIRNKVGIRRWSDVR